MLPSCICCLSLLSPPVSSFFFFKYPATTEIYTLSLHDALPILSDRRRHLPQVRHLQQEHADLLQQVRRSGGQDRKSTRLNSSHLGISYAVFCLKKKKKKDHTKRCKVVTVMYSCARTTYHRN